MPCFTDLYIDILYLEDGNVYRLVLKNNHVFSQKNLFLVVKSFVKAGLTLGDLSGDNAAGR